MKSKKLVGVSSALCLGILPLAAQDTTDLEQLKKQLGEMQKKFEQTVDEQRKQIESLETQIQKLQNQPPPVTNAAPVTPAPVAEPPPAWTPTSPIRMGGRSTYMDIGMVATFAAGGSTANDIEGGTQLGGHDPNQRGFTVQGVEANFNGAVDPFFRGNANVVYSIDSAGESFMELEEGWLESTSLPWNLKVRAGQVFSEFGRLNSTHPHTWDFVDSPLISGRFLGEDGLRNPGGWISWLTPLPFYTELMMGLQNSHGPTAASFRNEATGPDGLPFAYRLAQNDRGLQGFSDLLITPRLTTSFDLTDNQVLLLGASAALGPNSVGGPNSSDTRTEIYGLDATWKWKSPHQHGGFPFVKWQSEVMWRRADVGAFNWDLDGNGIISPGEIQNVNTGLPATFGAETLSDFGFYSQLVYGFHKGWTAGIRYDWLDRDAGNYEQQNLALDGQALGPDPLRNRRWRLSPDLTFYPSEFSKIRLQYNYDDRADIGVDHSVWLQFEFILGAHAAHKF